MQPDEAPSYLEPSSPDSRLCCAGSWAVELCELIYLLFLRQCGADGFGWELNEYALRICHSTQRARIATIEATIAASN